LYGNHEFVIDWENDGQRVRTRKDEDGKIPAHAFNDDFIFHPSVNWNKITPGRFSARSNPGGFLFDDGSAAIFLVLTDFEYKRIMSCRREEDPIIS